MDGVTFALSDLPSRTPDAPYRSSQRIDPFWDGLWHHGSDANWVSRNRLERLEKSGVVGRRPARLNVNPDEAWARFENGGMGLNDWQMALDILGALASWRTLTAEQFSALTGRDLNSSSGRRVLSDLFAMGLIDEGSIWTPNAGNDSERARMLRPASGDVFETRVAPLLSYAEATSITGGGDYAHGGQYDRHNILTMELILRAAEHLNLGTVLGEQQAVLNDLAFTSAGLEIPAHMTGSRQIGDAVIIRPDGVRIVIEMTSSWSRGATAKAEQWAHTLARRPFDDSGLIVLFVVADRASAGENSGRKMKLDRKVRNELSRITRLVAPGRPGNRTAERMFVTEWKTLFPERHAVSADFLELTAQRPTGTAPDGSVVWENASLLDTSTLPTPSVSRDLQSVIHASAGLRLVPRHIRDARKPPRLANIAVQRAGFDGIPHIILDPTTGAPRDTPPPSKIPERLLF